MDALTEQQPASSAQPAAAPPADPRRDRRKARVGELVDRFAQRTRENPRILRRVFGVMRTVKPIVVRNGTAVVTRFDDVQEVFHRDKEFTVAHYGPNMEAMAGKFILGMEDTPAYEHDVSVLQLAVPREDLPRIRALVGEILDELFTAAKANGEVDAVAGLTAKVPAALARRYFGPLADDDETLVRWARAMFNQIFINYRDDPGIQQRALDAAQEMRTHLDAAIAARKADLDAGRDGPDDVLGRFLAMRATRGIQIDDVWIRTYLMGLVIGMVPLVSKATALALDELLDRPKQLAGAQAAARAGDERLVNAYLFEAARFSPSAPGALRITNTEARIAEGTRRAKTIPAGAKVLVATQSAMFDGRVLRRPRQFRLDRPPFHDLHFGVGLHTCFGRYISREVEMPMIASALLEQPGLRRAAGERGRMSWDGPHPTSLWAAFDGR